MRIRTLHTSINLLIEHAMYSDLKRVSGKKKTPMSKIIRDGIRLIVEKIDREDKAIWEDKKYECQKDQQTEQEDTLPKNTNSKEE